MRAFVYSFFLIQLVACAPKNEGLIGARAPTDAQTAPPPHAAGRESGGAFVDLASIPRLEQIRDELVDQIRALPSNMSVNFEDLAIPPDWSSERIAQVIENVRVDSSALSLQIESDGRLKMMTYNKRTSTITVLAAFFLYYGRDLGASVVSSGEAKRQLWIEIKMRLLHEVAHLWLSENSPETEVESFARSLFYALDIDTLTCNVELVQNGTVKWMNYVYSFGHKRLYLRRGRKGMDIDDDGYVRVSQLDRIGSVDQGVEVELTADKMILSRLSGRVKYHLVINRFGRYHEDEGYSTDGIAQYGSNGDLPVRCIYPIQR